MRKLASIQTVNAVEPIPNADAIERMRILGWWVVVKKGEFRPGDKVVYCEIDSLLPERAEFEFLRASSFKPAQTDLPAGFRIKTVKLRGQVSQGICFPRRRASWTPQVSEFLRRLHALDCLRRLQALPNRRRHTVLHRLGQFLHFVLRRVGEHVSLFGVLLQLGDRPVHGANALTVRLRHVGYSLAVPASNPAGVTGIAGLKIVALFKILVEGGVRIGDGAEVVGLPADLLRPLPDRVGEQRDTAFSAIWRFSAWSEPLRV